MTWRTEKRNTLDGDAKRLRNALYESRTKLPTYQEKKNVHRAIRENFPEARWYSIKRHLTWCSGQERVWRAQNRRRGAAASAFLRAMQYAEPRLLWWVGFIPGPTFATMGQWADEAAVPVGTMADAIQQLTLMHVGVLQ